MAKARINIGDKGSEASMGFHKGEVGEQHAPACRSSAHLFKKCRDRHHEKLRHLSVKFIACKFDMEMVKHKMTVVEGKVVTGCGHFKQRIANFPGAFREATGEELFRGTLNVDVGRAIEVKEHFRIRGTELNEPAQDLKFEVCRINGIWGYRVRPYVLTTGEGGHGDHILEIACGQKIPNATCGSVVQIALFRDGTDLPSAGVQANAPLHP